MAEKQKGLRPRKLSADEIEAAFDDIIAEHHRYTNEWCVANGFPPIFMERPT
jgi:hypothetical protein